MKDYLQIAGNVHLAYYVEAADILGIQYEVIIPRMTVKFSYQGKHWFINNAVTPLTNSTGAHLSKKKNRANMILSMAGVPVPKQIEAKDESDAMNAFFQYRKVVLKPVSNLGGKGVSILPRTVEDVREAYHYARENDKNGKVLVEEYIEGQNYRVLVLGDKVISVVKRLPPHIIGDGQNDIKTLIKLTNEQRKERKLMAIPVDELTHQVLSDQGKDMQTIPANGEYVEVRRNANLTTGGTTEEINDIVHEYYKDICIKAVKALDLEFGGVDLITPDITIPVKSAINEINYCPGLRIHYKVDNSEPQKVAIPIMEYIRDKYTQSSTITPTRDIQ